MYAHFSLFRDIIYANKLRKQRVMAALDMLNKVLEKHTFLIGEVFTLADVCVLVDLIPILDLNFLNLHPVAQVSQSNSLNSQIYQ